MNGEIDLTHYWKVVSQLGGCEGCAFGEDACCTYPGRCPCFDSSNEGEEFIFIKKEQP